MYLSVLRRLRSRCAARRQRSGCCWLRVEHANAHRAKREIVSFTTSNDYTMEVLVAVDMKMKEFHGENMKNYVLILMSIVSSIYLDPTIGNAIKVAVVHVLLIHENINVKEIQAGRDRCRDGGDSDAIDPPCNCIGITILFILLRSFFFSSVCFGSVSVLWFCTKVCRRKCCSEGFAVLCRSTCSTTTPHCC